LTHGRVLARRTRDALLVLPLAPAVAEPLALTDTGPATWDAFAPGRSVEDAAAHLAAEFGAPLATVLPDVERLAATLEGLGALTPAVEAAP
jgi:hypothetical protein